MKNEPESARRQMLV